MKATIAVLAAALVGCDAVPEVTFAVADGAADGSPGADAGADASDASIDADAMVRCVADALPPPATQCCPNGMPCAGPNCANGCDFCAMHCEVGAICCTKNGGNGPSCRTVGDHCP